MATRQPLTDAEKEALFAKLDEDATMWAKRSDEAEAKARGAYARLLAIAETSDTGQALRVARFVAATYNGRAYPFDLFDLRGLDVDLGDDMLLCLDAMRWGKSDLCNLVPNGFSRIEAMIKLRSLAHV